MLNTLSRRIFFPRFQIYSRRLLRAFSSTLKFKSKDNASLDNLGLLDFLKTDHQEPAEQEDVELELDVQYLAKSIEAEDMALMNASSAKYLERISVLSSDDFSSIIKNQDAIMGLGFSDLKKLLDFELASNLQKMIDSALIKVDVKLRIISYLEEYQTVENIKRILDDAFSKNFEDTGKELMILIGAVTNKSKTNQNEVNSHISNICHKIDLETLNPSLINLISSIESSLFSSNTSPSKRPTLAKSVPVVGQVMSKANLEWSTDLMDEQSALAALKTPSMLTVRLFLNVLKFFMERNKSEHKQEIERIMALRPSLDLVEFLNYDQSLLSDLNYEQKVALYWIFSSCLNSKKFDQSHKKRLTKLLENLLIYDLALTNYLVRTMMGSLRLVQIAAES